MQPTHRAILSLFLGALLGASACTAAESNPEEPAAGFASEVVVPARLGSIERLHQQGGVLLASQPTAADFREAQQNGVKTVINLRQPGETGDVDSVEAIESLGLAYYAFGFRAPESLTDQMLDDVRVVLDSPDARPVLMYCSSANRVGAVWLAYRVLDKGIDWDQALAEAHRIGLRTPEYEARVQAYVKLRSASLR